MNICFFFSETTAVPQAMQFSLIFSRIALAFVCPEVRVRDKARRTVVEGQ